MVLVSSSGSGLWFMVSGSSMIDMKKNRKVGSYVLNVKNLIGLHSFVVILFILSFEKWRFSDHESFIFKSYITCLPKAEIMLFWSWIQERNFKTSLFEKSIYKVRMLVDAHYFKRHTS